VPVLAEPPRAAASGSLLREPAEPEADPVRAARLARRAQRLRRCTAVGFAATVACAVPAEVGFRAVLPGGYVPRLWHLTVLLAVLATGCACAAVAAGVGARDHGHPPGDRTWWVRWPINLVKTLVPLIAWCAAGVSVLAGAFLSTTVLEPASAGGCRVVVDAEGGYDGGWGTVFLLPAGAVRAVPVGDYSFTGGTHRTAEATWAGESVTIRLLDAQGVAEEPATGPFDCAALG
jgi:hypothetical protein